MRKFRSKGNAILTLSVICLLLVAVIVGLGVKIISSGTANTGGKTKVLSATAVATSPYPNFKGIYDFSSSNSSGSADKSYLAGDYLGYYWSQLEPQKGQYNWSIIDQDMSPWTSHGKKVILRISTSGWTSWNPPYSGNG